MKIANNLNTTVSALDFTVPVNPKERTILEILIAKTKSKDLEWKKYTEKKEKSSDIVYNTLEHIKAKNIDMTHVYLSFNHEKSVSYILFNCEENPFLCITYFNMFMDMYMVESVSILDNPQIKNWLLDLVENIEECFDEKVESRLDEIINDLRNI